MCYSATKKVKMSYTELHARENKEYSAFKVIKKMSS